MKTVYGFVLSGIFILFVANVSTLYAQWEQSSGPYGGVINGVACASNVLLAGTNSGLFRSTNEGTSWAPDMMIPDGEPQNVYALQTVDTSIFAATSSGLLASTDSGATWKAVSGLYLNQPISLMAVGENLIACDVSGEVIVYPLNGDFGTGPGYGLGLTNDNVAVDTTFQCVTVAGSRVIVGTDFGVYTSPDSGRSWTHSISGLSCLNVTTLASIGTYVFAGTDSGGVFRSTDGGATWNAVNTGLTTLLIRSLAVNGGKIYVGTNGTGVYVSSDNGAAWSPMNSGLTNPVINSFAFDGGSPIVGTDGNGVYLFNGIWTPISSGIAATVVNALVSTATGIYAGTGNGGVFLSTNDGASWVPTNSGMSDLHVQALCVKGSELFAGTQGGGVFVSTDSGATWSPANSGLNEKYVQTLAVSGDNVLAGTRFPLNLSVNIPSAATSQFGAIFISTDNGNTWTKVDSNQSIIRGFATIGHDVVAATFSQASRSTDNGLTWAPTDSGLTYEINAFGATNDIAILSFAVGDSDIFAGTSGEGMYFSTNEGVSWNPVDKNLEYVTATALSGDTVFAASAAEGSPMEGMGIFRADVDSLTSWVSIDSDFVDEFLPPPRLPPVINAFLVNGNYLFAGTNDVGAWRMPLSEMTGIQRTQTEIPAEFTLYQNYPNPFNPTTNIGYRISNVGLVTLKVYNVLGELVKTLVNKVEQPGNYKVTFDAAGLASGVYFYRLQSGNYTKAMKLMLLK